MGLLFTPKSAKEILQEKGEKRAYAKSATWYTRMKQAEREGRDFNEPPPFLDDNDADQKQ